MKNDQVKLSTNKNNKFYVWTIVIIIILIIIILLLLRFYMNLKKPVQVPTGNIDIFDLKCDIPACNKCDYCNINNETPVGGDDNSQPHTPEIDPETLVEGFNVFDNKMTWTSESELRIFTNPALEFTEIIAPGSTNTYVFRVRNNNSFDVEYDILFTEINNKKINIQYKLKKLDAYLFGNKNSWVYSNEISLTDISLLAKNYDEYVLEWKWIESDNDTALGVDATAIYKLMIEIIGTEV